MQRTAAAPPRCPPHAEAAIEGTTAASFAPGTSARDDPLKSVKGFARAPKRGRGHHDEEMTEMEVGRWGWWWWRW